MTLPDEDDFEHYFNACVRQRREIERLRAEIERLRQREEEHFAQSPSMEPAGPLVA